MKLYLDNSFLNRPFDDASVGINNIEAEVLFLVIGWVKQDTAQLVNSSIIEYENGLNPFPERKEFVRFVMGLATDYQRLDVQVQKRARALEDKSGVKAIDALHIASAEAAGVDFFVTCDYDVVKRYKGRLSIVTPLTLAQNNYEDSY